jgi:endonuclease/exonuclease/phosphatase (EEP) superfamily protein YafD
MKARKNERNMNNVVNTSHIGYKIRDVLLCGKFTLIVLCVLTLFSVARFTGFVDYWLVDVCSHFPVQYGIVSLGVLGICLWKKRFSLGFLAAILSMINLSIFAEYKPISQSPSPDKDTFTVYLANIWRFNPIATKLSQEITRVEADCVLLLEVTPECMKPLQPVIRHFPYRLEQATKGSTGLLFLSRYPIIDHRMNCLAEHGNRPLLSATLQIGQQKVSFYGAHPPAPSGWRTFHARNSQLLWLADQVAKASHPVIVAGDFNTTPFSPVFQAVLVRSGLKDTRTGAGWFPSWPTYMPLCWLPIDHILVSSDIRIHHVSTGTFIWSDHYPVIAELSIMKKGL